MTLLFVTGTGTGVGKTYCSAQIVAAARARGLRVRAAKPVLSGYDAAAPRESDAGVLLEALGLEARADAVEQISPWRFSAPLSPDMAARREGRTVPFDALVEYSAARLGVADDLAVVEGVGGVMAPLDAAHTVLDWIAALRASVLLVAGSYLGTLSHTLTAALALREHGCALGAVAVCESAEQPVPAEETAAVLARFLAPLAVKTVPRHATWRTAAVFDELIECCTRGAPRAPGERRCR